MQKEEKAERTRGREGCRGDGETNTLEEDAVIRVRLDGEQRDKLLVDHLLQLAALVQHVGDAPRHARSEVAASLAQDDGAPSSLCVVYRKRYWVGQK